MTPDTEARLVAVLERIEKRLAANDTPELAATRRLATAEEAMALLGVKRTRLFDLVREKKIVRVLEGLQARFDVDSIERYLALKTLPANDTPVRRGRPPKSRAQREAERMAKLKA